MPDNYKLGEFTDTNPPAYKQTIVDALNDGAIGWLGSVGQTTDAGTASATWSPAMPASPWAPWLGWISADWR